MKADSSVCTASIRLFTEVFGVHVQTHIERVPLLVGDDFRVDSELAHQRRMRSSHYMKSTQPSPAFLRVGRMFRYMTLSLEIGVCLLKMSSATVSALMNERR